MKICTLISATILAAVTSTSVLAKDVIPSENSDFSKWGEAEGWTVFVVGDRGTCLIERKDENGNVVQMGLTSDHEFGYLGVFTQADIKIKNNKVHLRLDDRPYVADAKKKTKHLPDGYKGGYILANNPDFVNDVMKRYNMVVMPEDANAFEVSLDGTLKAIEAARKCNMEQAS